MAMPRQDMTRKPCPDGQASTWRARVLLSDDHRHLLEAFMRRLEPQVTVVGRVTDGRALVQAALELRPDVVVANLSMPERNARDAARGIQHALPRTRLVFLTVHEDPGVAAETFRVGTSEVVVQRAAVSELLEAIRDTLADRRDLTLRVADGNLKALGFPLERLSPREREVLQLLADGGSMKQVGARLGITPRTVAFHKYRLMAKLAVGSTAALVRIAAHHRLA